MTKSDTLNCLSISRVSEFEKKKHRAGGTYAFLKETVSMKKKTVKGYRSNCTFLHFSKNVATLFFYNFCIANIMKTKH